MFKRIPLLNDCMDLGVVIIGRNEGERLRRCLESVSRGAAVVYVDSGSTDGSAQWARNHGADVIELNMRIPFTAARARNAGFRRLRAMAPDLPYVQFVDGDCELTKGWPEHAMSFLDARGDIAVVCGRLRERYPEQSIYNWLCEREWNRPPGEVDACGGIAVMRVNALEAVGGFRDNLIAYEEPELCVRLQAAGYRIWRLDFEMAVHDAAMTHFGQWWRRALRVGYGVAQCDYLYGATPQRHWVWQSRRAWLWGVSLPLACLVIGLAFEPWGWAAWLIFPLQILRQTMRNPGQAKERALLALFQLLARFPEACGQIKFMRDRLFARQARIIEYK
jgi:glycosyltransferase involved in cell wall biosynthesis